MDVIDILMAKMLSGGSGGGGSLYVVNYDSQTGYTDKTAGEIFAHLETDRVIFRSQYGGADGLELNSVPIFYSAGGGSYQVVCNIMGNYSAFNAESSSDYMRAGA